MAEHDASGAEHSASAIIAQVDVFAVSLPLRKPMTMAGATVRTADNIIVRITSREGLTGWGEAASAPAMTGETVESMAAAVRYVAPWLTGMRANDFASIDPLFASRLYGNHAAKGAIDMALLDLTARVRDVPLYRLFGPERRRQMPVLWLIGTGSLTGDVDEARARRHDGFTAFKIKIGVDSARADALRTQAVCEALGEGQGQLICADANQGYDEQTAIEYARSVEHMPLDFIEQPVAGHDLQAMARVAAATGIAIGADEGVHGEQDIRRHHDTHAAEGCSLKVIKLGGPRALWRAGQLCQSLGMQVNLACKIAESSIASAALLHLAAVMPALQWGISPTCQYLAEDVVLAPLHVVQGAMAVPTGAGLGVAVDEHRLAEFAYAH